MGTTHPISPIANPIALAGRMIRSGGQMIPTKQIIHSLVRDGVDPSSLQFCRDASTSPTQHPSQIDDQLDDGKGSLRTRRSRTLPRGKQSPLAFRTILLLPPADGGFPSMPPGSHPLCRFGFGVSCSTQPPIELDGFQTPLHRGKSLSPAIPAKVLAMLPTLGGF